MRKFLNLKYGDESPYQNLDLYLPTYNKGPYPLVVFIHGGGWQIGDKRDNQYKSWLDLVNNGYALACINYRMFPDVHPKGIFDCKKALFYLQDHSQEYNLDMDRVGLVGNSAGGFYALLLTTSVDHPRFSMGRKDVPIQCCIGWYTPTDFIHGKDILSKNVMNRIKYGIAINCIEKYFGKNFNQLEDSLLEEASSTTYINENLPPILLQQGDKDFIVPPEQAQLFYDYAKKKGVEDRVTIEMFPGAVHVDPVFDTNANRLRNRRFLNQFLKNK